jgi:hypothetical protein
VVVAHSLHIEARGAAFYRNFTNQASLYQVPQIAVDGGPG